MQAHLRAQFWPIYAKRMSMSGAAGRSLAQLSEALAGARRTASGLLLKRFISISPISRNSLANPILRAAGPACAAAPALLPATARGPYDMQQCAPAVTVPHWRSARINGSQSSMAAHTTFTLPIHARALEYRWPPRRTSPNGCMAAPASKWGVFRYEPGG